MLKLERLGYNLKMWLVNGGARLVHIDPSKFSMCMICVAMRWSVDVERVYSKSKVIKLPSKSCFDSVFNGNHCMMDIRKDIQCWQKRVVI